MISSAESIIEGIESPEFVSIIQHMPGGEKILTCIQCGTCTGSCPTGDKMPHTPRTVMRMLQLGLEEEVMRSDAVWLCADCYTCTLRCPRNIKVSEIMAGLRTRAIAQGYAKPRDTAFLRNFLSIVKRYGRTYEAELLMRYNFRLNPFRLLKQTRLGLAMFRHGKVGLLPERIKGRGEVQRIYRTAEEHHAIE
jgi:heterodisulfide reductase subunit C